MKLLHIIATPRRGESGTLKVSGAFLEELRASHGDVTVDVVDLYDYDLPAIAGENIEAKYTLMYGQPIDKGHEAVVAPDRNADRALPRRRRVRDLRSDVEPASRTR